MDAFNNVPRPSRFQDKPLLILPLMSDGMAFVDTGAVVRLVLFLSHVMQLKIATLLPIIAQPHSVCKLLVLSYRSVMKVTPFVYTNGSESRTRTPTNALKNENQSCRDTHLPLESHNIRERLSAGKFHHQVLVTYNCNS